VTENTFPFAGAPQPPVGDDQPNADARRRTMLIAGGVAGVLVLVAAAYFFPFKGSSSGNSTSGNGLVASAHHPSAATGTAVAPTPSASAQLQPSTYDGVIGRDPFKPLYVQPAAAPSAAAPTGGQTGATSGTAPATSASPSTAVVTGTNSSSVTNAPVEPSYVYAVKDKGGTVTFRVGYTDGTHKNYTAKKGQTFAAFFSPLSIQPDVVSLQVGDGGNFVDTGFSFKKRAVCTGGATSPLMCSNPTTP